jgi:hypothetical protein
MVSSRGRAGATVVDSGYSKKHSITGEEFIMRRVDYVAALACVIGTIAARPAPAQAPEVSAPDFRLIEGFNMPGQFPTSVTAANLDIAPVPGAFFDGAGEDQLKLNFPAAGPSKWTSSRANSGDIALSIGPAFPENALSYPDPDNFVDNFQAMNFGGSIDPNSRDLTTLAWRVGRTGALFSAPRHNGVNNGYLNPSSEPVGTIYGVSYFIIGASQGWGFRMSDGVFANGGGDSSDLVLGAAGSGGGLHEAVSNVATAYLPYLQGWEGAWVNAGFDGEATFASSSPDLPTSTVNWSGGTASVALMGVNSASDGMLFVAPANGGSQTRIAAAFPDASGGWTANVRLDEDDDTTGQSILTEGNEFQFVYVPYDADNLIGGHVAGNNGTTINSAGDAQFDVARTAAGQYAVTVFESDGVTKKDESDGMLMLSVADSAPGAPTLADRTFLSYQYDSGSGTFVVQSRELLSISSATPDDSFGNDFGLRDSDFYFAWVDFANPLAPPSTPGDFDGDGDVDAADLDDWEDSFHVDAGADADGDGDSDGADFLAWQQNVGAGVSGGGAAAVPEPASIAMILLSAAALAAARRLG